MGRGGSGRKKYSLQRLFHHGNSGITEARYLPIEGSPAPLTEVESVDGRPLAGALLAGDVGDLCDEGHAVVVVEAEDVSGDLDEERVEDALVPLFEHVRDLGLLHPEALLHDLVRLADQLHVAVLDTVVDHLDVVSGSGLTDPVAACWGERVEGGGQ